MPETESTDTGRFGDLVRRGYVMELSSRQAHTADKDPLSSASPAWSRRTCNSWPRTSGCGRRCKDTGVETTVNAVPA